MVTFYCNGCGARVFWFPLTHALNSLDRGLGLPDLYPYVLSAKAIEKLRLVHEVITAAHGMPSVGSARLIDVHSAGESPTRAS